MADRKQLEIRQLDIEKRYTAIAEMPTDDVTPEVDAELGTLRAEHTRNATQLQALMLSAGPETPLETRSADGRDFRQLIERSNVGEIVHCAIFGGTPTGATAEIQKHFGVEQRSIPLAMLINRLPSDADIELRRSNAPADVGTQQESILPYVFPQSASVFLGIDMPSVGVGEHVYPVMTTAPANITTPAEGVAATESNATFTADVLAGKRFQTFITYSREDRAKFAMLDSSLRENLSDGMGSELDKQMLTGTDGLLNGTVLANHNVTAVTTYALYRSQLAHARVDGSYAMQTGDIRILMGADTYEHAAGQYRGNNDNTDALAALMSITGGVRVSGHMAAAASNKQNALVRLGSRPDFVQPVWSTIELLVDELTMANEGIIKISAIGLFNQKLLRAGSFYKQQTQHA